MSTKKVISILLICCFLVSSILVVGVSAADAPAWNFDATGTLTINAPSALADYASAQDVPWNLFAPLITTVSIDPAISYIGTYSLNNLNATIEIDNGNTEIAPHAFDNPGENFLILSVFDSPVLKYAQEHGIPCEPFTIASGTCGSNALWKIYPDGTLHILGSGPMTDYYRDPMSTPWYVHASAITKVLVDESITYVSPYTVFLANTCTSATILGSDTQVSDTAFQVPNTNFTIFGHLDSSAYAVAQKKGYQFEPFTIADGTWGTNVTWALYTNGLLKIDGTGEMENERNPNEVPYYSYGSQIKAIEIGEGITKLSDFTYFAFENCTSFTIWNSRTVFTNLTIAPSANKNMDIRGYKESTAEEYAKQKSIPFAPCSPILTAGTCGDNVTWMLHENGRLQITGEGAMADYSPGPDRTPWMNYRERITSVEVGAGITTLSSFTSFNQANCATFTVLNPRATLPNNTITVFNPDLIIIGYKGSTAETFAASRSITFVPLD